MIEEGGKKKPNNKKVFRIECLNDMTTAMVLVDQIQPCVPTFQVSVFAFSFACECL